jgi:hypothetical protein
MAKRTIRKQNSAKEPSHSARPVNTSTSTVEISPDSLDILLGEDSELKLAIRDNLRSIVGVCPEHDDVHEAVALALELAETAMLWAHTALDRHATTERERVEDAAALVGQAKRLQAALDALYGERDVLGEKQAFVLTAINYAATQVPVGREKLGREIVLFSLWKMGVVPFEIFGDQTAHERATDIIKKWRSAGGRGRSKWEPAQEFLASFNIAPKNAAALKECAEKYGIAYLPPKFEDGSPIIALNEFDLVAGRFTGCPCCHPEQFEPFRHAEK